MLVTCFIKKIVSAVAAKVGAYRIKIFPVYLPEGKILAAVPVEFVPEHSTKCPLASIMPANPLAIEERFVQDAQQVFCPDTAAKRSDDRACLSYPEKPSLSSALPVGDPC